MSELLQEKTTRPPQGGGSISAFIDDPVSAFPSIVHAVPHQALSWPIAQNAGVQVFLRRDDAIHPLLSGNKLYKLWGHYCAYKSHSVKPTGIASFGGAYSNHLHALAALGQLASIPTVGIIRGERPSRPSQTLLDLEAMGMRLQYVSRADYKRYAQWAAIPLARRDLTLRFNLNGYMWVAEGGAGPEGQQGCAYLGRLLSGSSYDVIAHACGTGTSLAGLAEGLVAGRGGSKQLLGIAALKGGSDAVRLVRQSIAANVNLADAKVSETGVNEAKVNQIMCNEVKPLLSDRQALNMTISNQFHCGGFAKLPAYLAEFMQSFEAETRVTLDKVYTAKLFWGLQSMIARGLFAEGASILAIHSGGLQGNRPI